MSGAREQSGGGGADEQLARLWELDAGAAELDDERFERLARRISAAGAERLRRRAAPPWSVLAARWARPLIPLGVAAGLATAAVLMRAPLASDAQLAERPAATGAPAVIRVPDHATLLAAAVGSLPEEDFFGDLWDRVDAESLLSAGDRP
jgi:hypothetical protein